MMAGPPPTSQGQPQQAGMFSNPMFNSNQGFSNPMFQSAPVPQYNPAQYGPPPQRSLFGGSMAPGMSYQMPGGMTPRNPYMGGQAGYDDPAPSKMGGGQGAK